VPPVKKASTRSRVAAKQPAALRQLTTSLDGAQSALAKLRADIGRDVSGGSKALYKDLERFVKDARRDSGKLGKALERELAAVQKRVSGAARPAARKSTAAKASAKPAARKGTAAKPAARKSAAKASAKPVAARTSSARKATARKPAVRKATARKPAARRSAAK
jgi:hypothetical protein